MRDLPQSREAALFEFVRIGKSTPARVGWSENGKYHECQVNYEDILRIRPLVKLDA